MIEFRPSQDLFESNATILVNATNMVGVTGGGIALAFKQRYPAMFEEYVLRCREGLHKPGVNHYYAIPDENEGNKLFICNLATKAHFRDPSEYCFVADGLRDLRGIMQRLPSTASVAIPRLGCGLGGLNWSVVCPLIVSYMKFLPNPVYVYGQEV